MFERSASFEEWRNAARPLLAGRVGPEEVEWSDAGALVTAHPSRAPARPPPRIASSVLTLLESLSMYRAAGRWDLMYRLALRSLGHAGLLEDAADPDVRNASLMERAVKRDLHKMHAFVRFRETTAGSGAAGYFAWFEPQHEILREAAEFFVQRFPNHDWTIATPDGAAVWKAGKLHIVAPPDPADRPRGDDCEELWRTYYRSICNVVRINPPAMQREMPRRYWRHLPESAEIDSLIRDGAANFARDHHQTPDTCRSLPVGVARALPDARLRAEDAQSCHRCELWRHATQAVVGEGDAHAHVMLVGEQPGDEEDLRGRPFVGPAGKVLDLALAAAGLDRRRLFLTNAVRHFKWEPRGKRRLHQKPVTAEVRACNIWLEQEIAAVKPVVIVALGATALRALTGAPLSVEDARAGMFHHPGGARILATYHPAAILRADGTRAGRLTALLEADLRSAAAMAAR